MVSKMYTAAFLIAGLAAAFAVFVDASASASTPEVIFGPVTFPRTKASPNEFIRTFSTPGDVFAPFTLNVQNGNPGGSNSVSAATIVLNSDVVVRPNEFKKRISGMETVVELAASNNLSVALMGKPGSFLVITISGVPAPTPTPTPVPSGPREVSVDHGVSGIISGNGRFVVFASGDSDLVPEDTNNTERVSIASDGTQADGTSFGGSDISGDGRYVAFTSDASNLVLGDTDATRNAFVHDRNTGITERIPLSGEARQVTISDNGRLIGVTVEDDIFVYDRVGGTSERVSVTSGGTAANARSFDPTISGNGRSVTFVSDASNLGVGDTNALPDAFIQDRQTGVTQRFSVATDGTQTNDVTQGLFPLSADGRYVAFGSTASSLVGGDTNDAWDIFIRDRQAGVTARVSVTSDGTQGGGHSPPGAGSPSISVDGSLIVFTSNAPNLVSSGSGNYGIIVVENPLFGP